MVMWLIVDFCVLTDNYAIAFLPSVEHLQPPEMKTPLYTVEPLYSNTLK